MSSKKPSSPNYNPPISARKADKIARRLAKQEIKVAENKLNKKSYWTWQRAFTVFLAFVVLFGFVLYTFLPILFR
jgi:hypothetical protein